MRMHTCLHLLCAVVPHGVTGGKIGADKSSLNFDIGEESLDKEHITTEINRLIAEDHPVMPRWVAEEELDANPDLVRTMSVKPPRGTGRVRLLDIPGIDLQDRQSVVKGQSGSGRVVHGGPRQIKKQKKR